MSKIEEIKKEFEKFWLLRFERNDFKLKYFNEHIDIYFKCFKAGYEIALYFDKWKRAEANLTRLKEAVESHRKAERYLLHSGEKYISIYDEELYRVADEIRKEE